MFLSAALLPAALLHQVAVHPAASAATNSAADWIRRIGVIVGVLGAGIAGADGLVLMAVRLRQYSARIRERLARFMPFLRRPATIYGSTAISGTSRLAGTATSRSSAWGDFGSEELRVLRRMVEGVRDQIAVLQQQSQQAETVMSELRAAHGQQVATSRQLAERMETRERRGALVDARGFLPIAFGIILAGVPDGLAAVGVWGWVLTGACLAITAQVLYLSLRDVGFLAAAARAGRASWHELTSGSATSALWLWRKFSASWRWLAGDSGEWP